MESREIYTERVTRGKRTYFFEIMKCKSGLYIRVSESTRNRTGFEHHRLMVFPEDLGHFVSTITRLQKRISEAKRPV